MEAFSRNFRRLRTDGALPGRLFEPDVSLLSPPILALCNSLDGRIPQRDDPPLLAGEAIARMFRALQQAHAPLVPLGAITAAARDAGVPEPDVARLEAHVRMNLIPEWIDFAALLRVLARDREEVLAELEDPPPAPEPLSLDTEAAPPPVEATGECEREPAPVQRRRSAKRSTTSLPRAG
jgi:hypothetical protein